MVTRLERQELLANLLLGCLRLSSRLVNPLRQNKQTNKQVNTKTNKTNFDADKNCSLDL